MKKKQPIWMVFFLIVILLFWVVPVSTSQKQEALAFADQFQQLINAADSEALKGLFARELLLVADEIMEYEYEVFQTHFETVLEMGEEERLEYWDMLLIPEKEQWRMEEVFELVSQEGFQDPKTSAKLEEVIRYGTLWQMAYFATMDESWEIDEEMAILWIGQSSIQERGFLVPQDMVFALLDIETMEPMEDEYEEITVNQVGDLWYISMIYHDEEWGPHDISFAIQWIDGEWLMVELH